MKNSLRVTQAGFWRASAAAAIGGAVSAPALASTNPALQDALSAFTLPEGLMVAALVLLLVGALVARRLRDRAATRHARTVVADVPDLRWWRKPIEPGGY